MQSLKSANSARVNVGQSSKLFSDREHLGAGLMAMAGRLHHDIYGRAANQNTLRMLSAADAQFNKFTAQFLIQVENAQRAYNPIAAVGLQGAGDFAATGRDVMPQGIYGDDSGRGNFQRLSHLANNELPDATAGNTQPQEPFNPRLLAGSYKSWTKGHGANNQAWASKW